MREAIERYNRMHGWCGIIMVIAVLGIGIPATREKAFMDGCAFTFGLWLIHGWAHSRIELARARILYGRKDEPGAPDHLEGR